MVNAISSALSGLQTATRQVEKSAQNIANLSENTDLAGEAVTLSVAKAQYGASLSVLKAQAENDQELARLFDKSV